MATKKRRVKRKRAAKARNLPRETSNEVSALAGQWLRCLGIPGRKAMLMITHKHGSIQFLDVSSQIQTLAASCLVQDTTPGLREKGRRR